LYAISGALSQQVPCTVMSHRRSKGMQWIQLNRAVKPMAMLVEMSRNHTNMRVLPVVSRRMVSAKLVLDQMDATTDSVPAKVKALIIGTAFAGSMSHECLPRPRLMQYEMRPDSVTMRT